MRTVSDMNMRMLMKMSGGTRVIQFCIPKIARCP